MAQLGEEMMEKFQLTVFPGAPMEADRDRWGRAGRWLLAVGREREPGGTHRGSDLELPPGF